jgi:hypothetical protein
MNKKYKVILAANPLTDMEQEAINALTTGGAAKYITEFKKEIEKYKTLDPGAYQQKLKEVTDFYVNEEKITNEIAVKLKLPIPLATKYVDNIVDTYGLGRPDAVNLIASVLNSSSAFGFTRDDAIEYMRVLLGKFKDTNTVASKAAEDFKSMQELAAAAEIPAIEIYDVFLDAVITGDFSPVWAIITIVPILKIDLLNKDTKNVKSIFEKAVPIIERAQGIALPLSQKGEIINKLVEASNEMKFAFNPILEFLTETMIARQIEFFNLAKKDFINKPDTFKALYDSHNKLDADFYNLQERRDLVNKRSTFAPASDLVGGQPKKTESKMITKYKIIIAAEPAAPATTPAAPASAPASAPSSTPSTTTPSSAPASNNLDEDNKDDLRRHNFVLRLFSLSVAELEYLDFEIQDLITKLDNYLTLQPQGVEGDNILSFLNDDEAKVLFEQLKLKIKAFNEMQADLILKIQQIINEQKSITPSLDAKRDQFEINLKKAKIKSDTIYGMKLKEFEKKMRAAPYLKEFEDKKKTYDAGKSRINAPSTKFIVPVKVFNPDTKTFTRMEIPRGQFILYIGKIGEDCIGLLRQLATIFASIGDKNSARSSKRFLESANQLEAENEEFISKNLNPFAPSVGEPR